MEISDLTILRSQHALKNRFYLGWGQDPKFRRTMARNLALGSSLYIISTLVIYLIYHVYYKIVPYTPILFNFLLFLSVLFLALSLIQLILASISESGPFYTVDGHIIEIISNGEWGVFTKVDTDGQGDQWFAISSLLFSILGNDNNHNKIRLTIATRTKWVKSIETVS